MHERMTRQRVIDALRMAWLRRRPAPGLIFHKIKRQNEEYLEGVSKKSRIHRKKPAGRPMSRAERRKVSARGPAPRAAHEPAPRMKAEAMAMSAAPAPLSLAQADAAAVEESSAAFGASDF